MTLSEKSSISWTVESDPHRFTDIADTLELRLSRDGRDWKAIAHRNTWNGGWLNHAEFAPPHARLQRVIVHWINLPNILARGRIAVESVDGSGHCWLGRWRVEVDGWCLTLDRRHDYNTVMTDNELASVFALTHVMELRRADGESFDVASANQVLECLRVCLSFAFGRWVAPVLPVGYDSAGHVVWEEWAPSICHAARQIGAAWLYRLRTDDLVELIRRALPAFTDPTRPGITRFQMISAVQSVETGFVEQRILTTFPALENLAWVTLVLGGLVSREEYKNPKIWPGEARLRRLLELARIPACIEAVALPALAAFAADKNRVDGPSAVTTVRNRLVHPQTPNDQIYHLEGLVRDAWLLSRHYLNLLILHSIGYQGSYVRLLPPYGWAGDAKPVPWQAVTP